MCILGALCDWWSWVLLLSAGGLALYYHYVTSYTVFSNNKTPHERPLPFIGNSAPTLFWRQSLPEFIKKYYDDYKGEPFLGVYQFGQPVYMLRDLELIKKVSVKDFEHFVNRFNPLENKHEPLAFKMLTSLKGLEWKNMRSILSPAFTTSKMKAMFGLISDIGGQMADYVEAQPPTESGVVELEMKDFFTKYTNDVIATAAFGIQCDSLKNQDNEFYKMGKDFTNFKGWRIIKFMIFFIFPFLVKVIRLKIFPEHITNFYRRIILDTISLREREGIVRPDMIQLLMAAKKGELKDDSTEDQQETTDDKPVKMVKPKLDDDDIVAQGLIFFFAGFETTSTFLCFTTQLLAQNPEVQERLQQEIDSVLEEDGKLTYEGIQGMKYLDMVVSEALRIFPPAPAVDRVCTKPYTLPATDTRPAVTLNKGDMVWFPIYALHRDPEYFPDPERFDPERFSDENKHNIQPYSYLPFGVGPRNCIGMRFAQMESKVAIVQLLARLDVCIIKKSPVPLVFSKKTFAITVDGGFWLGLKPRTKQL